ncbi:MAG: flagellar biosynthetic protein FliO [Oscillospiraceae bacterium]|nr:flagellar biosynthetic protein FliO [Oscillospiraceae bacterium]
MIRWTLPVLVSFQDSLMIFVSLLGVIGLIFLTYAGTKWLNKKFRLGGFYGEAKGIKIVECAGIAQDKQLMIVRIGKKLMLLGVTAGSVTKICDLDEDDLAGLTETESAEDGFLSSFKKVFAEKNKAFGNARQDTSAEKDGREHENEF